MYQSQKLHQFVALIMVSAMGLGTSADAATFYSIGGAYEGALSASYANGISGDGSTVVGRMSLGPAGGYVAYRWRIGSPVEILPFSFRNATAVSYDGSVVVGGQYRWTQETGAEDLGALGFYGSQARDVSADGSTVVGRTDSPDGPQAYRWTESGGMQGLGFLPAANDYSSAAAVSADGSVIVGSGYGAFIWTESTGMANLATVGPLNQPFLGAPHGISADGSTVVGENPEAWYWTANGGVQFLGFDQGVYDASGDGTTLVGGQEFGSATGIAFIYDADNGVRVLQDLLENYYGLDLTGWRLYAALGISDDGTKITGHGINPFGQAEAWYVDLSEVPLPPAIWLLASGLLSLVCTRRKR